MNFYLHFTEAQFWMWNLIKWNNPFNNRLQFSLFADEINQVKWFANFKPKSSLIFLIKQKKKKCSPTYHLSE